MRHRAPRNRTLLCTNKEIEQLSKDILQVKTLAGQQTIEGQFIAGDFFKIARYFPAEFVDLLILDPPYNLSKNFNGNSFKKKGKDQYVTWFQKVIDLLIPMMKPDATLYVCSDWTTSTLILPILGIEVLCA